MTDSTAVDRVAEAIWGNPANRRVVSWASMDEKIKELWREDARRAIAAYNGEKQPEQS